MADLVGFIRAQLAEDERIARAACWDEQSDVWTARPPRASYERYTVVDYLDDGVVAVTPENADADGVGRHIAEHDPARVLREIGAKRRLLDDYIVTVRIRDGAATRIKAAGDHPDPKDLDEWDRAQREAAILEGPVRLAASVYDDKPGYLAKWAPSE